MAKDVLITPGDALIQFSSSAGTGSGQILADDNNNLVISNLVGDVLLGDGASDVFIGDGTNNVDIVFEQNGEIRDDTSGKSITLGSSTTNIFISGSNTIAMQKQGGNVGIGKTTATTTLEVAGEASASHFLASTFISSPSASLTNITTTNITASGNISASGNITASSYTGSFVGDGSGLTGVTSTVDIDGLDALGGTGIAQGDKLMFSDAGTEKSITFSNLEDAIFGNVSGEATIAAGGALTIAANSIGNNELKQDDDITLQSLTTTNNISGSTIEGQTLTADVFLSAPSASITNITTTNITASGTISSSGKHFGKDFDFQLSSDKRTFKGNDANGVVLQDPSGGWAMRYGFLANGGTDLGGFGGFGGTGLTNFFIGGHYTKPVMTIQSGSTTAVGIGRYDNGTPPSTLTVQGDISASGGISSSGTLHISPDVDSVIELGRAKFGPWTSDYMYLSHHDMASNVNYALNQTSAGVTSLNAASGRSIQFKISNDEKMTLASDGKVGIGTTSPTLGKLHISGSGTNANYVSLLQTTGSITYQKFANKSTGVASTDGFDIGASGTTAYLINRENAAMEFYTNAAARMKITGAGNVGIGTTNPTKKLHVAGETSASHFLASTFISSPSASLTNITTTNITASGNISSSGTGIFNKLEIHGADGTLQADYIIHKDDENTKFGFPSNDHFKIRTAGTDRYVVDTVHQFTGDITTDSNISSSGGTFTGNFPDTNDDALHFPLVTAAQNGTIESQNSLKVNPSTSEVTVAGTLKTNSHLTASANVKVAGNVEANGNIVGDNSTNISGINNITASGHISSSGNVIGNLYQPTFHNFVMTADTENYIPFPTSATEATSTSYLREWVAPFDGSLSKIRFRGSTGARNTTFKLYVNAIIAGGATATSDTVNAGVADTTYTFTFDETAAVYSAGDLIRVTIDPLIAPQNVNLTMIWNYNTNSL